MILKSFQSLHYAPSYEFLFQRQELRQTVSTAGELPKIGANLYQLLRDEGFSKVFLFKKYF